jgi:ABC-type dipeptide/oligopeptide/nickel transport system permease component/N-acetylneuraminic acid mutarotase
MPVRRRLLDGFLLAAMGLALAGLAAAMVPAPLAAEAATPPSVAVASMTTARAGHTATYLNNGLVLVAGGRGRGGYLRTAESYDRGANAWIPAASMAVPRSGHTAILLPDSRVLVIGGVNASGPLSTAELYDPDANRWSSAGTMRSPRIGHTATLLPDGRVLVVGGGALPTAEIFDPSTNQWLAAASMNEARQQHSATLLADGNVLVAGGLGSKGSLASAEIYHPSQDRWSPVASMNSSRAAHTGSLIVGGRVLVAGGLVSDGALSTSLNSVEGYDPARDAWSPGPAMVIIRSGHVAIPLCSNRILVAGGVAGFEGTATEQYDDQANAWLPSPYLLLNRNGFSATLIGNCRILFAGGADGRVPLDAVELLNPAAAVVARTATTASVLPPTPGWLWLSLLILGLTGSALILIGSRHTLTGMARPLVTLGFQSSGILIATWLLLSLARVPVAAPANVAGAARPHELQLLDQPVGQVLVLTGVRSLGLIALALVWSTFLGLGIALIKTSLRQRRFVAVGATAAALWITPTFILAILVQELQAFIAGHSGLVVAAGFGDVNGIQLFWAAVVLGLRPAAYFFRHSDQILGLESALDYVRTAQAKGLAWHKVVSRHMLRGAAMPLLATWSNSLRVMIGSLPLVEYFFGYPGLGRVLILSLGLTYTGPAGRVHGDLAMGLVVTMAVILITLEAAAALLQQQLDPRLRAVRAVA